MDGKVGGREESFGADVCVYQWREEGILWC